MIISNSPTRPLRAAPPPPHHQLPDQSRGTRIRHVEIGLKTATDTDFTFRTSLNKIPHNTRKFDGTQVFHRPRARPRPMRCYIRPHLSAQSVMPITFCCLVFSSYRDRCLLDLGVRVFVQHFPRCYFRSSSIAFLL